MTYWYSGSRSPRRQCMDQVFPVAGKFVGKRRTLTIAMGIILLFVLLPAGYCAQEESAREHPYLLVDESGLEELKKKFNDPAFAEYRQALLKSAKKEKNRKILGSWLYHFTGKSRYRQAAISWMKEEASKTDHDKFRMGEAIWMAVNYDLLHEELAKELRGNVEDYLDRVVAHYLKKANGKSWWYGAPGNWSNTVVIGAAGGGIAGLAVMHRNPEGRKAAERAAEFVARHYRGIRPQGGCTEGSLYWNYALTHQLYLGHALKNTIGDKRGLLTEEPAPLDRSINFIHATLGGFGGLIPFNDTQPWLTGAAIGADLGNRFDQDLMRWLADRFIHNYAAGEKLTHWRENAGPYLLLGAFLWRDRTAAPETFPGVPTAYVAPDIMYGALRSRGDVFRPEIVVGLKGAHGEITHHHQSDQGSYTVDMDGVSLLIDPGYFNGSSKDHSLPVVDGVDPYPKKSTSIEVDEQGDVRFAVMHSTNAYWRGGPEPRRVDRWVVLVGDSTVVILDDILPAEEHPGKVVSRLQCGQPVKRLSSDGEVPLNLRVAGQEASARIRIHGPVDEVALEPRKFNKGWIFKKLAKHDMVKWTSVEMRYSADPDTPLITVLQRETDGEKADPLAVKRRDEHIEVSLPDDRQVHFRRNNEGWEFVKEKP